MSCQHCSNKHSELLFRDIVHCVYTAYNCLSCSALQDYKTYLDFVLALENRKEPAALQYIFKLLDMENQGYLNVFSLNYFFRVRAKHTDFTERH